METVALGKRLPAPGVGSRYNTVSVLLLSQTRAQSLLGEHVKIVKELVKGGARVAAALLVFPAASLGRLGRGEDVAPMVRFLCSDEASFITGQTIYIGGGLTA